MSAINFEPNVYAKMGRFNGLSTDITRRENFHAGGLRRFNVKVKPLKVLATPPSLINRYTLGTADRFWEACPEMDARLVKVNGSINGTNIIGRATAPVPKGLLDPRYAFDYQSRLEPNLGISATRKITVSNF